MLSRQLSVVQVALSIDVLHTQLSEGVLGLVGDRNGANQIQWPRC